jgi:hypothetical protein
MVARGLLHFPAVTNFYDGFRIPSGFNRSVPSWGWTRPLSSHAAIKVLGMIVTAGSAVTYCLYWEAYTSVWCFFSAPASSVIVFHFEKARQRRLALRPSAQRTCC